MYVDVLLASNGLVESGNDVVFLFSVTSVLDVRSEVVHPP